MNAKENLSQGVRAEAPVASPEQKEIWGSDAIAAVLRAIDVPYLALNPGASYRGLHDSIVNYLGNRTPQMLLSIHDENAVTIAHGYAKATDRMMAAALHSNVGLMHATMSSFDAWWVGVAAGPPPRQPTGRPRAPAARRGPERRRRGGPEGWAGGARPGLRAAPACADGGSRLWGRWLAAQTRPRPPRQDRRAT